MGYRRNLYSGFHWIFARCSGCGHPIENAADARQLDEKYYCPACYELEKRKPLKQMELFK